MMRDYRDLVVWQRADQVVIEVYRLTSRFPGHERFGLANQMRRAAVSVASNIAEASGRDSLADGARLLSIAAGSASEIEYQLGLAVRLGYADRTAEATISKTGEVKRMLRSLIRHWRRNPHRPYP